MAFDAALLKCLEVGEGTEDVGAAFCQQPQKAGSQQQKKTASGTRRMKIGNWLLVVSGPYFTPLYSVVPLMLPQRTRVSEVRPQASE